MTLEVAPDSEFEERRKKTFWERLDDAGEICTDRHKRQTARIGQLEAQNDAQAADITTLKARMMAVEQGPVEATRLMLTGRGIVALVLGILAIWTGQFVSTAGVKEEIRAVATAQNAQQKAAEAAAKLQDVQMATLRDAAADAKSTAADAKRQYELLRYEFQSLKETVIKGKTK